MPAAISVAQVIDALEGPFAITECASDGGSCSQESHCAVRANWQRINDTVWHALATSSFAWALAPSALYPPNWQQAKAEKKTKKQAT